MKTLFRPLAVVALAATVAACSNNADESQATTAAPAVAPQATASSTLTGTPVMTVGGRSLPMSMVDLYTAERANGQPFRLLNTEDKGFISQELINLMLLAQHAQELGLDQAQQTQLELQLQTTKVMARAALDNFFADNTPTEEELLAEYNSREESMVNTQFKARHILVESQTEARNLITELDAGADFSELAKAHSTDGGSGPNGGDLGWFMSQQMVPQFSEATAALEVGQRTAEPVESQFGWHIIQLDDRKEVGPAPFEQMKPAMTQFVQQAKVEAYLAELAERLGVDLSDEMTKSPDYSQTLEQVQGDHAGHDH